MLIFRAALAQAPFPRRFSSGRIPYTSEPPRSTRACVRGRRIQKFAPSVISAQWDHIALLGRCGPLKVSLLNVFTAQEVTAYAKAVDAAKTPDDLAAIAEPVDDPPP
jgi:hypothetical protein